MSVSNASGPRSIAGGAGGVVGWVVAVFGAGGQDALDGAVRGSPTARARAQAASNGSSPYFSRSRMIPWMARSRGWR